MSQAAFASDTALIIQGLLIFSAAVVGVIGYYVQSKLAAKARKREIIAARAEHLRQLELTRVREKLDDFIGPISHLCHSWGSQIQKLALFFWPTYFPEEHNQHKAIFKEKGGWGAAFQGKGEFAYHDGMFIAEAGTAVSKKLTEDPLSEAAVVYRKAMKRMVMDYAVPAAELIKKYAGHLQEWTTTDEFKKSYSHYASNGLGRNLFFVDFQSFAFEFRDLIMDWENGDYTTAWPIINHYHLNMWTYPTQMITRIREIENGFGSGKHAVTHSIVNKDGTEIVTGDNDKSNTEKKKKSASGSKKYVVAAGVAGVAAAAAVTSGS